MAASPLEILHCDDYMVAVNKPAGLLVHRSEIDRHETVFLLQRLRNQIGQRVYPVHRLDKPTSGVIVFALSSSVASQLGEQFTAGTVEKTYHAVVRGIPDAQGVIDYALKEKLDKYGDKDAQLDKPAQPAITQYRTLASIEIPVAVTPRYATSRYALVELSPKTGRKHQLRRHMKHIFHPIVGDTSYGDGKHNQYFRDNLHCSRLCLESTSISLLHPIKNSPLFITLDAEQRYVSRLFRSIGGTNTKPTVASLGEGSNH